MLVMTLNKKVMMNDISETNLNRKSYAQVHRATDTVGSGRPTPRSSAF